MFADLPALDAPSSIYELNPLHRTSLWSLGKRFWLFLCFVLHVNLPKYIKKIILDEGRCIVIGAFPFLLRSAVGRGGCWCPGGRAEERGARSPCQAWEPLLSSWELPP